MSMTSLPRQGAEFADRFAERTALICAAGTGWGYALARLLADRGAHVVLRTENDRPVKEPETGITICGPEVKLDALVHEVCERISPVSFLVFAEYGRHEAGNVSELPWTAWEEHLAVLRRYLDVCRLVLPGMRSRRFGRICSISGAVAIRPAAGLAPYACVKAALSMVTRTIAIEEGKAGITANLVAPARISDWELDPPDTPLGAVDRQARERMTLSDEPSGADVAGLVMELLSPRFDVITGHTITVTGGELLV